MSKVLVIQFRTNPVAIAQERVSISRGLGSGVEVEFVDALDLSIDWNYSKVTIKNYQGIIFGGSGDLDFDGNRPEGDLVKRISLELLGKLRPLFQYLFDNDIPTLGICYGHQIIGAFAGAQVHCDKEQSKTCSHEVKLLVDKNKHILFTNVPDSFFAHYGHKDVLDKVPAGAVLLMSGGERCKVTALQYKNNIYTVQFHPELTFSEMVQRMRCSEKYLPEGVSAEEIFKDDSHSNTILHNFCRLVAGQ